MAADWKAGVLHLAEAVGMLRPQAERSLAADWKAGVFAMIMALLVEDVRVRSPVYNQEELLGDEVHLTLLN